METTYALRLIFKTDEDKTTVLTVPYANNAIEESQIAEAMDQMIASNAIFTANGNLNGKEKAEMVRVEKIELAVK